MFTLLVLLTLVAVARAARLVTADKITEPIRDWICRVVRNDRGAIIECARPKLLYFITCPWCTSIWIGAVAAGLVVQWPDTKIVWALMILGASSEVAGLLAGLEGAIDSVGCHCPDEDE